MTIPKDCGLTGLKEVTLEFISGEVVCMPLDSSDYFSFSWEMGNERRKRLLNDLQNEMRRNFSVETKGE